MIVRLVTVIYISQCVALLFVNASQLFRIAALLCLAPFLFVTWQKNFYVTPNLLHLSRIPTLLFSIFLTGMLIISSAALETSPIRVYQIILLSIIPIFTITLADNLRVLHLIIRVYLLITVLFVFVYLYQFYFGYGTPIDSRFGIVRIETQFGSPGMVGYISGIAVLITFFLYDGWRFYLANMLLGQFILIYTSRAGLAWLILGPLIYFGLKGIRHLTNKGIGFLIVMVSLYIINLILNKMEFFWIWEGFGLNTVHVGNVTDPYYRNIVDRTLFSLTDVGRSASNYINAISGVGVRALGLSLGDAGRSEVDGYIISHNGVWEIMNVVGILPFIALLCWFGYSLVKVSAIRHLNRALSDNSTIVVGSEPDNSREIVVVFGFGWLLNALAGATFFHPFSIFGLGVLLCMPYFFLRGLER